MKVSVAVDFLKRHRLQISVHFLVVGILLTGLRFPMPDIGVPGLPATVAFPIFLPQLVPLGKLALFLGAAGGGVAVLSKWMGLAPDDSAKLAKAVANATKSGLPQFVETRADRPNVVVQPIEPPKT